MLQALPFVQRLAQNEPIETSSYLVPRKSYLVPRKSYLVNLPYRSTSPMTTSIVPIIAIRSAIKTPFAISCKTDRFTKLHERHLHRNGISLFPSARKKKPSSPFGISARTYRS